MRNPPDTHFKLNPVITVGHGVFVLVGFSQKLLHFLKLYHDE